MNSELLDEILDLIETQVRSRPTAFEFEMAYQARVAIERIRFAIKHAEQFGPHTDPMREVGLQLLDAVKRLETVDRRFQLHSCTRAESRLGRHAQAHLVGNQHGAGLSDEAAQCT